MANYLKTVSELIIEQLEDGLGSAFGIKTFYDGDPGVFPQALLPAFCVMKTEGQVDQTSTQRDDILSTYLIKLIYNQFDYLSDSATVDPVQKQMEYVIEGRDYDTGYYVGESVLGVLRQHFTLPDQNGKGRLTSQKGMVKYGVVQRPDEKWYSEAHVQLTINERIVLAGART